MQKVSIFFFIQKHLVPYAFRRPIVLLMAQNLKINSVDGLDVLLLVNMMNNCHHSKLLYFSC